jgi:nucleoside-diphosphate-sugar epimerase
MNQLQVVILGCGYTGRRVAARLLGRGIPVLATTRNPSKLVDLASQGAKVSRLEVLELETLERLRDLAPPRAWLLHSIPVIDTEQGPIDPTPRLLEAFQGRIARIVYLSTTGVYGMADRVDETTPALPASERERLRKDAERAVAAGSWSSLILRPAAIYGPGRGVHESIRLGRYRLAGDGDNFVSRIHVEDLAALAEAALFSELTGAYPVADQEPCTARQMAEFCAELLALPLPPSASPGGLHPSRHVDRRVDGGAILRLLGISLQYPSYRIGVPASLSAARG